MMLLRRIAYTLLTIFRSVTQRSDQRRSEPWKALFQRIYDALLLASDETLAGLRRRARHIVDTPPLLTLNRSTLD